MCPECKNCGSKVSEQFARVNWDRTDTVPACPNCEDAKMMDGDKHEYRG